MANEEGIIDEENFTVSPLPNRFKNSREGRRLETDLKSLFKMTPHINTETNPTYATSALRQV